MFGHFFSNRSLILFPKKRKEVNLSKFLNLSSYFGQKPWSSICHKNHLVTFSIRPYWLLANIFQFILTLLSLTLSISIQLYPLMIKAGSVYYVRRYMNICLCHIMEKIAFFHFPLCVTYIYLQNDKYSDIFFNVCRIIIRFWYK